MSNSGKVSSSKMGILPCNILHNQPGPRANADPRSFLRLRHFWARLTHTENFPPTIRGFTPVSVQCPCRGGCNVGFKLSNNASTDELLGQDSWRKASLRSDIKSSIWQSLIRSGQDGRQSFFEIWCRWMQSSPSPSKAEIDLPFQAPPHIWPRQLSSYSTPMQSSPVRLPRVGVAPQLARNFWWRSQMCLQPDAS